MRALVVGLVLGCVGCGTIVNGGHQDVSVHSPTPNAEMVVKSYKGREVYSGPTGKVSLSRDDQYTITVTAPGFKERKLTVTKSMSGWTFGNLVWILPILWGVGIAVDAASGGLWKLSPEETTVSLKPEPTPPPPVTPPLEPPTHPPVQPTIAPAPSEPGF